MKIFRTQEGAETWKSVSGDPVCQSIEVKYVVIDAPDKSTALKAVWGDAPDEIEAIPKKEMRVDGYEEDRSLSISVVYERGSGGSGGGNNGEEENDDSVMSFECSTSTMHITNAISQKIAYGSQDAGGLIGWHGAKSPNEVDGVDIVTGSMTETYSKRMKRSDLTNSYRRKILSLTGKVNSSAFKGWSPGEVLFLGASFSAGSNEQEVTVTFQFAIQPNEASYRVNNVTLSKKGFEYVSSISDNVVKDGKPRAVIDTIHVSQVYQYKSFASLGL